MVIFNSYVSLPEGTLNAKKPSPHPRAGPWESLDFYREKESSKAQNYVSNMIYPLVI